MAFFDVKKKKGSGFRKKMLTLATFLSAIIPSSSFAKESVQQDNPDDSANITVVVPTRTIAFQVDTVKEYTGTLAQYSTRDNSITVNYREHISKYFATTKEELITTLIHEQKHADNNKQGMYVYPISPDQAYTREIHNEVSANIAELIYLRDKYIKTGDITVFNNYDRFSFYKEAIQQGNINPNSKNRKDFDAEMSFIINGMIKTWEKEYGESYSYQCAYNSLLSDRSGAYSLYHNENYKKVIKMLYTIGGVDFSQYLEKDVEIPLFGKKQLNHMLLQKYEYVRNLSHHEACSRFSLPEYNKNLTLGEYRNLLQHALVLRHMADNSDTDVQDMLINDALALNKNEISQQKLQQKYDESFQIIQKYFKGSVDAIIDCLASEHGIKNKKSSSKNKKGISYYQNAINDLYSINVDSIEQNINLRYTYNPTDKLVFSQEFTPKISEYVKYDKNKEVVLSENLSSQYRQWKNEDGYRVSDVQQLEAIDLTKKVISQPEDIDGNEIKNNSEGYFQNSNTIMAVNMLKNKNRV